MHLDAACLFGRAEYNVTVVVLLCYLTRFELLKESGLILFFVVSTVVLLPCRGLILL